MKRKRIYRYFVSYYFSQVGQNGYGNAMVGLKYPIRSFDDLKYVKEIIEKKNDALEIMILNFRLFD